MDIQRRKPPQKTQSTQGGVQFRKRVFDRSLSTIEQEQLISAHKTQSHGEGDQKALFAQFRAQMGTLGGGVRAVASTPRKAYKSLAEKSRSIAVQTTIATSNKVSEQSTVTGAEKKENTLVAEQSMEAVEATPESLIEIKDGVEENLSDDTQKSTERVVDATPVKKNNALMRALRRSARRLLGGSVDRPLASIRVWQTSMIGAMAFGMVAMSAIMWNFGQSARATDTKTVETLIASPVGALVETQDYSDVAALDAVPNPDAVVATQETSTPTIIEDVTPLPPKEPKIPEKSPEQVAFEERVTAMVAGYPIEKMLPEIFKQDIQVAAYIVAMAKIESAWGQRVPVLNGQDCFNYWGYRAKRERMGTGGHTCFDDYADAVRTVGKRIHKLVYTYEKKTPRQMLVWKCGSSCATHDPAGVERWVGVIAQYRNQALGL